MTVHEDMAEALWEDIQESPETVAAMFRLRNRHIRGEMDEGGVYGTGYADALGSSARFQPKKWPLAQHAAFINIHALIGAGDVAFTCISTGGTPGADADRAGNARKLADTMSPFQAELDMHQNGADSDGVIRWDEPLKISRSTGAHFYPSVCRKQEYSLVTYPTVRKAGSAPLEVGDSWPSRTLMHLHQYGAVARWPYGSKLIWLFINFAKPSF
ncbi:hypothetical protein STENM36S_08725 [Streptomyces tendae]